MPTLMRSAPRSLVERCLCVSMRSGALRMPEKAEKIGIVVCSGFT
jgi:hypothetical protein